MRVVLAEDLFLLRDGLSRTLREHGCEVVEVDSRPSDAIALGVASEVPIFVEDHVLREVAQ